MIPGVERENWKKHRVEQGSLNILSCSRPNAHFSAHAVTKAHVGNVKLHKVAITSHTWTTTADIVAVTTCIRTVKACTAAMTVYARLFEHTASSYETGRRNFQNVDCSFASIKIIKTDFNDFQYSEHSEKVGRNSMQNEAIQFLNILMFFCDYPSV